MHRNLIRQRSLTALLSWKRSPRSIETVFRLLPCHRSIHFYHSTCLARAVSSAESIGYPELDVEYLNIDRALHNMERSLQSLHLIQRQQSGEDESAGPLETSTPIKDKEDLLRNAIEVELKTIAEQIESMATKAPTRQTQKENEKGHSNEEPVVSEDVLNNVGEDPNTRSMLVKNVLNAVQRVRDLERPEIARSLIFSLYGQLKRITNELEDLDLDKLPKLRQLTEIELNTFIYNALLGALSFLGHKESLLILLSDMKDRKVMADATTYHHLVVAAINGGDFMMANKIMEYLDKMGIQALKETIDIFSGKEI